MYASTRLEQMFYRYIIILYQYIQYISNISSYFNVGLVILDIKNTIDNDKTYWFKLFRTSHITILPDKNRYYVN